MEDEIEKLSFKNGVLVSDHTIVPKKYCTAC